MDLFKLPPSTLVGKVIPKNAFDSYTNSKQQKLFTKVISQILWVSKLSKETINLDGKEIDEIQIFYIDLKIDQDIKSLLEIIDRAIPYPIIFIIGYNQSIFLSTSTKHQHPLNPDNAVIDWTFKTDWFLSSENAYSLNLKISLDAVYHDFCKQLTGEIKITPKSVAELANHQRQKETLQKEIDALKAKISKCQQFNQRVELNILLKSKEAMLDQLNI